TGQVRGNRPAQRARPGSAGDRFSTHLNEAPAESASMAAAAPMTSVAALLAVQDEGDATSRRRRRAVQRGTDLLDRLDEIRHALLTGDMPSSRLQAL
ncbi:flagellar assembly protein FliX, partial [Salmonella enterica]|uniref:flagellar assembly protein FliX n=1 Tax=Salmonella enterica TaxID=28901 RepID=UPI003D26F0E9